MIFKNFLKELITLNNLKRKEISVKSLAINKNLYS